jgi:ParB-like chromosome segregation protein Spo0J
VLAIVRTLNESEARGLNARENTERDNLRPADIAWSIAKLQQEHKLNDVQTAQLIGKSNGYVGKLARIMEKTHPAILKSWREMPNDSLSIESRLELIKVPKEEQLKKYEELTAGSSTRSNDWMVKSEKQARRIGHFFGTLEKAGALNTDLLDFYQHIKLFVTGGMLNVHGKAEEGATENQWSRLAAAAEEGWEAALRPTEEPKAETNGKTVPVAAPAVEGQPQT